MDQADAEIALLDEEISRTRVTAPFDSFVVSGDLSQALGSPVERGDTMFELAPLDSYRVILEVDERDIDDVAVSQDGQLALTSDPDNSLPISIEKITPLSTALEGRNYFRVEARLDGEVPPLLRPGMEGVGKIQVDQRKLLWIWTHKILHWMQMFFWSWWP
jgi:multidrug efflux pump subunit AcrA (membrane-fusion protein)